MSAATTDYSISNTILLLFFPAALSVNVFSVFVPGTMSTVMTDPAVSSCFSMLQDLIRGFFTDVLLLALAQLALGTVISRRLPDSLI